MKKAAHADGFNPKEARCGNTLPLFYHKERIELAALDREHVFEIVGDFLADQWENFNQFAEEVLGDRPSEEELKAACPEIFGEE